MKKMYKFIALMLAVLMLATVAAACGEKTDGGSTDTKSSDSDKPAVAGSEQTWGNLTVFVPDTMDFKGGDGTFDPDDENTAWLNGKTKATDYIKVTILDSEDDAKNNVETTKSMNEEYSPTDVELDLSNGKWTGVTYSAFGTDCVMLYCTVGDKVYFTMSAGFSIIDETLKAVLESLK